MDQSQCIEEKNWALSQAHLPWHMFMTLSRGSTHLQVTGNSQMGSVTSPNVHVATTPYHSACRGGSYKRLSDAKYQDKLRKGLCFLCDEKYGPNHRCNSKQLNVLIVATEDIEDGDIEEHSEEIINIGIDQLSVQEHPESQKLMELSVLCCRNYHKKVSEGNADVVLVLERLKTLGDIQANFKMLTLKFEIGGQTRVIQGDPSLSRSVASLKILFKALQKDGKGYYVDLNELTTKEDQENLDLQQLLQEFGTSFEELKGLPPSRSHDQAILLNEGSNPPNIRPYRHPQY
ncbi:hypothetical protein FXO38_30689 [Capsicum annuum]|nr:hypothetical protein FXO38_30689 [Capsicum annuum]